MKSEQRKERMDPLKDMKHYVATKKKCLKMEEEAPLHVKVIVRCSRLQDAVTLLSSLSLGALPLPPGGAATP